MTKRERFMNFLANKPVDRVPVALFHHFGEPHEWYKGLVSKEIFENNIEGHRKARKIFDPDVIKVMNDSLMIMPVDTSFVKKASDLRNLEPPIENSPFMKKTKELTERVLEIYEGSDAPTYATGFSPFAILRKGMEHGGVLERADLLRFLEEDPDSVVAGLDRIADSVIALDKMLLKECGVEGIYFSVNNQSHFVPDEWYPKYIAPSDKKVMANQNALSKMNMLHICGYHGQGNNLELYKDYESAAYNWAVHTDGVTLGEGKKFFGGKPVFGGFEQSGLIDSGTREEIEAYTAAILDEAGTVGVMIGADCTVPTHIDDNRLEWVRQACIKYAEKQK